ncbi:hypothetical protein O4160_08055 [Rhodococcus sp. IEGM 1401]|uniref:hypothetical protein n=1 Tax=unclassified Rhodococcus (in: high G+C Gram-positive bacteria) TaxID=192944 RepID=UPI0022B59DDE|nr:MULTISPECIES: hypothetical protein [unclassified Rhodococcus (in: high G+C Gram-positive bacteria)]MCZ4560793.1 hypothetical protein [Rhodococcus sp. IEGM 1401]MDI9920933.1 hypothetical protein [Rhodococcus sp. IEGM 1372]MDV8033466.1 hypothetical protein [Rhodococcus sp. IEGM 1414]
MDVAEAGLGLLRDRVASTDAREAVENAVQDRLRPLTARVTGRAGVGKSAVLAVLESVPLDADGLDVRWREGRTDSSDGEVLVHVIAGAVSPVDTALLSSRPRGVLDGTVVVLTKADTLDDPAADAAAASQQLGRTVLPVMGATAAGLRGAGAPLDMADVRAVAAADLRPADLMTVDRFRAVDIEVSTRRREALIECIELRGLALLVDVLRQRPAVSDGDAVRMLADATGADALIGAVSTAVSSAAAARDAELHRSMQQISAGDRRVRAAVESYLASDEAVAAEMRCAALFLGVPIETGSEQVASEQAVLWKRRAAAAVDPDVRRAALALCRGHVRMLRR